MKIENVTPLPAPSLSAASTQFDAAPLRIVIAGSVDDGKSTLTGRFLYDAGLLLDDQLAALEAHSTLIDGGPDFAALTDGLTDEREQGITIDVAYRYFALHGRRVILADVPGHEQYTRNMVTAASDADAMVLLVDAERGPTPQTWRHLTLALLLGVSHIVVAVNKMDRIGFDSDRFADLSGGIQRRAAAFDPAYLHIMPVSALAGDNVVSASQSMPWYSGETLFDLLAGLPAAGEAATPLPADEMRLPVRYVSRPAQAARRAYLGRLAGGPLAVGDTIAVSPGGRRAVVEHLYALGEPVASADAGQSVSVVLDRDLDIARGDVFIPAGDTAPASRSAGAALETVLFWFGIEPQVPGRVYELKTQTRSVRTRIETVSAFLDATDQKRVSPDRPPAENDIALAVLAPEDPVAVTSYRHSRSGGSFILIDPDTHETVAAGLIGKDVIPAALYA
tara:strand:- start:759 stop:2108 length:1350 start_codon:yes stop_codon:yes gene_type:complete